MSPLNRRMIIGTTIAIMIIGVYVYSTYFSIIYDDQKLISAIKADPNVKFSNIKLGGLVDKGIYGLFLGKDISALQGFSARYFEAYEYPVDSIPLSENRKVVGLIDERLNIVVSKFVMRGDGVMM